MRFADPTSKVSEADLRAATEMEPTTDANRLADADVIFVAVPTPVDGAQQLGFSPLAGASASVGANVKRSAIVVYESTV